MAIEQFITKGDDALKSKDYLGAISYYSRTMENPQAFSLFEEINRVSKLRTMTKQRQTYPVHFPLPPKRQKSRYWLMLF